MNYDDKQPPPITRRDLLKIAGALPVFMYGLDGLPVAFAADGRQIAGYDRSLTPSPDTLAKWLKQLHDFGPIRATGTPQARAFEEWLAAQVTSLGFTLERDQYRLTSWECDLDKDCSIAVTEDGGARKTLDVVAYYPFTATTRDRGPVTGRVLYGGTNIDGARALVERTDAASLANAIVVVDMPLGGGAAATTGAGATAAAGARAGGAGRAGTTAGGGRATAAATTQPLPTFPSPLLPAGGGRNPAGAGGGPVMDLLENRCKALVLCFIDIANESGRYNYLPFSSPHRKIPSLWIGAVDSKYIQSVSGKATMTLRLDAKLTPNARADSLVGTMKGKSDEAIFLTTHTDGPNEVNDNGALGVLALATHWAKRPASQRNRTLVVSLPTGHYAAGAISDPVSGSGERAGTRGVMGKRPDLMKRVVGQIALEQMGAMEWVDRDGKYIPTGNVARERWIPTESVAQTIAQLFVAAASGEDPKYSASFLSTSGAPGEGGAPRTANIPGIGLMGGPSYFFRCDPKGVLDKLSPQVMYNEVAIATKMMLLMDRLTADQLGGKAPITNTDLFG